jgi:hypothetical protein
MTLFSRFLAVALVAALALCVVVVLTTGHPNTAFDHLGDLYHRVVH